MIRYTYGRATAVAVACLVILAASAAVAVAGYKAFTPGDLHKLKRLSDVQLSSDGEWIAYVVSIIEFEEDASNSDIWIVSSDGGEPRRMTTSEKGDGHPRWSPDGAAIAFLSGREGSSQIFILPVDGGEALKVTDFPGGVGDFAWMPDGSGFIFTGRVYLDCPDLECITKRDEEKEKEKVSAKVHTRLMYRHWNSYDDGKVQHLFHIPADGGEPRDLTPELEFDALTYWLASAGRDFDLTSDGAMLYFSGKQDEDQAVSYNEEIYRVPVAGGPVEKVTDNPAADSHPRVSPSGNYLAYRATRRPGYESDRYELMVMELPDGEPRSITRDFDRSVGSFFWGHKGKKLYFQAEDWGDINLFSVPLDGGTIETVIGGTGGTGHGYHLDVQAGPKEKFFVYSYRPMTHYYEIFRCSGKGTKVRQLSDLNGDLYGEFHFPDAERFWFEGPDGTPVHGFLVKPMDFNPGLRYPMMVRVHGGPQQMFGYAFRPEYAFFSGANFAVFFCNPRGSTGYGREFCDGIRGDWGGTVIDDIRNGVRYVLEQYSWIDPERVGAWGGSYGGFVCNWLQGHNGDKMFSALVSHAGEADQWNSYGSTEELWFPEWDLLGPPWEKPGLYDELSPIRYAKNFATPHLIVHGELDYRVPITGGEQMFTALQRLGVPSKMIRFPDEDHWIQKPHNQQFWYASILDWFEQWLVRGGKEKAVTEEKPAEE
ncbi:MAG TPA: S9 family peptidase [Patescibacteria group bacterium]|nr:S9 family peptidase [Patescibacteria group bacterium]